VAAGDFNGDGKLDLAVGDKMGNRLFILLARPTGPAVTFSPSSLNFGTQVVGTSSQAKNFTLLNIGDGALNLTGIVASANFSQRNDCGSILMPGASCTISVKFKPSSPGTQGTVTITDNAPNSPQTVMLTGVGTVVTLSPTSLNFGNQTVGTTSAPQTVTLTNHARRVLNIFGDGFSGTNPGAFAETHTCGRSLAAGASCTVNVTFTPTARGSRKRRWVFSTMVAEARNKCLFRGTVCGRKLRKLSRYRSRTHRRDTLSHGPREVKRDTEHPTDQLSRVAHLVFLGT
jgi:hypothetical protein